MTGLGTVAALTLLCAALCWWVVRDWPAQAGVDPLGAGQPGAIPAAQPDGEPPRDLCGPVTSAVSALTDNWRRPAMLILLVSFAICGWSTNGIVQTHFVPAAHDHSMPATTAAGVIGLIGIFDVLGTVASGWLTAALCLGAAVLVLLDRRPRGPVTLTPA